MPALYVKEGPRRGAVIEVRGERFVVGQDAHGEAPSVAAATRGQEAVLSHEEDGWYIQPSPGAAETWLNDQPTEHARLRHLDEIRIGNCRLVFLEDDADAERVLVDRFGRTGRRTHVSRLGEARGIGESPAGTVQLPLSVILEASDLAGRDEGVARVLNAAVATVRRTLSADTAVAVIYDGSELRPVLAGRPAARDSLDALSVNTHLIHASLTGGYAATWTDCEPQPHVACAPIRPDARLQAAIYVGRPEEAGEFSAADLATLVSVAAQSSAVIGHVSESRRLVQRVSSLERQVLERNDMVGESPQMRAVHSFIEKVAPTDAGVLICGETGTGKELVARAIHARSRRSGGPLEVVNCAAIAEQLLESELFGHVQGAFTGAGASRAGRFELADGGTLVLDEITEMSLDCQARLLRVLEDAQVRRVGDTKDLTVDVRVVAVTNRDPATAVSDGKLRGDLFYRLDRLRISLPPLRERGEDVELLARHFARLFGSRRGSGVGVSADAVEVLRAYRWPGNVRELRNVIERAVLLCDGSDITTKVLPEEMLSEAVLLDGAAFPTLVEMEKAHVRRALLRAQGNKSLAARLLGIDRTTLYAKVRRLDLE